MSYSSIMLCCNVIQLCCAATSFDRGVGHYVIECLHCITQGSEIGRLACVHCCLQLIDLALDLYLGLAQLGNQGIHCVLYCTHCDLQSV